MTCDQLSELISRASSYLDTAALFDQDVDTAPTFLYVREHSSRRPLRGDVLVRAETRPVSSSKGGSVARAPSSLSTEITVQPLAAKCCTIDSPIPLAPPVTTMRSGNGIGETLIL